MKILLVGLYYFPKIGGVENSLKSIAKELISLGHEVAILTLDSTTNRKQIDLVEGVKVFRFPLKASVIPPLTHKRIKDKARVAFDEVILDFSPDQIWTRNSIVASGLLLNSKVKHIKHIFSTSSRLNIDGLYNNIKDNTYPRRLIIKFIKLMDYLSLFNIDKVLLKSNRVTPFVFSSMMREQILNEHKIIKKNIRVVKPGVDRSLFNRNTERKNQLISKYNYLEDKYFLYVGRVANSKNVDILIDSIKLIKKLNLVIVGEGPQLNDLQERVAKYHLTDRVFFMGSQKEDLPLIYTLAEVTVLPTKIETFGQVLIESLSCGTPVIGFGENTIFKTAVSEIIIDENYGKIVNNFSPFSLSNAIVAYENLSAKDKEIIAKKNTKYVSDVFNWKNTVELILNDK